MIHRDPHQMKSCLSFSRDRLGLRVAICPGCFDLLHAGHVKLFREARRHAEIVIAATNTDASIRRAKGETRPVVPLQDRMAMLDALAMIDDVICYDEDTPENLCRILQPDVMVKGEQYFGTAVPGAEYCKSTVFVDMHPNASTTSIIGRICN